MDTGASSYRRYLDGDEGAFEEIVKEYFDNLVFFIYGYVRDAAAAEDIAIDAFSDLIVHKHRYNFSVTLKTYLFMIGRSRALNYIKRRGKLPTVSLSEVSDILEESASLEQLFFMDQRKKALHKALGQLSGDLREVVNLVYFEDLSCQEAAKVMKKNVKQVYNLLYRAKESLRTILNEEGEFTL